MTHDTFHLQLVKPPFPSLETLVQILPLIYCLNVFCFMRVLPRILRPWRLAGRPTPRRPRPMPLESPTMDDDDTGAFSIGNGSSSSLFGHRLPQGRFPYSNAWAKLPSRDFGSYLPPQQQGMFVRGLLPWSFLFSFLKFLLIFSAGGLFFSTFAASVAAIYAMGMENVARFWILVKVVLQQVWATFVAGLQTARTVLVLDDSAQELPQQKPKWKWRDAWQVLKQELAKTRRTAVEGVQALRQEAQLYAAVVGPPGLIPLQYLLDRLLPYSIATILENALKDSLSDLKPSSRIKKVTLTKFTAGSRAPVLAAARAYEIPGSLALDWNVDWSQSQLEANLLVYAVGGLARIPVSITNFSFKGPVRLVLTPLCKEPPGFGAMLVSLPGAPQTLNMDVRVAGGLITQVPWLRREILSQVEEALRNEMLWPKRVVIPQQNERRQNILRADQLKALETSDPLLVAERELEKVPMFQQEKQKQKRLADQLSLEVQMAEDRGNGTSNRTSSTTSSIPTSEGFEATTERQERGILFQRIGRRLGFKKDAS